MKIAIVGCGVIGLSCGIQLLEQGFSDITIFAKDLPPHTTSNIAGAIWMPFKVGPTARVNEWGKDSLLVFQQFIDMQPTVGVSWISATELYMAQSERSAWMNFVSVGEEPQVIPPGYPCRYTAKTLRIDTTIYMEYLKNRFIQLGGHIQQRVLQTLNELENYPFIINCSGLGARELAQDDKVYPIKGQLIKLEKINGLDHCLEKADEPFTFVLPRTNDCIVGTTVLSHDSSLDVDHAEAKRMLERAITLVPQLADVQIIEHLVGLRPGREEIRLEAERFSDKCTVIHNYGHGGGGITLSWGCALNVVRLLKEAIK